ncbi:hypothetical protein JM654_15320 [Microbacterium oxydans]|nr:hypothetical protein [Microbacterium oxydans]
MREFVVLQPFCELSVVLDSVVRDGVSVFRHAAVDDEDPLQRDGVLKCCARQRHRLTFHLGVDEHEVRVAVAKRACDQSVEQQKLVGTDCVDGEALRVAKA